MGSRFVEKTIQRKTNKKAFQTHEKPILAWFQFVPALVLDVVTGPKSMPFDSMHDINAIIARPHYEDAYGDGFDQNFINNQKYYPLFRGMVDTPVKGDQVLVCTFGGQNYYMGPVNTINTPNWNPDMMNKRDINFTDQTAADTSNFDLWGLSKNFKTTSVKRLTKLNNDVLDGEKKVIHDIHGDMAFEGRHGNSIRIGSRDVNPYIIISNGRSLQNIMESLNDGSLISMTEKGSLKQHFGGFLDDVGNSVMPEFLLASDIVKENKRIIGGGLYNYRYGNEDPETEKPIIANQILIHSDRITLNAKSNDIFLSSFKNTIIGSGNSFQIYSNNETIIESSNIYLGKQASEKDDPEPLLLGKKVSEIFNDIVSILEMLKVSATIGGISGTPTPDVVAKIQTLKSKLQSEGHLSDYHYIEDNGQKQ